MLGRNLTGENFMVDKKPESEAKTPPYVSFKTVKTLIQELDEHGIPARLDRSVLTRFSGTVRTQLMTALRFLGLINDEGIPTDRLAMLVGHYGDGAWPPALRDVLVSAYRPLFQLDLINATPSQFVEKFKASYPGTDAVQDKSRSFFLAAATEAGIPISQRILKGRKPRGTSAARPRKSKQNKPDSSSRKRSERDENGEPTHREPKAPTSHDLLAMLNTNTMTQEQQDAVWLLIKYAKENESKEPK
jgi:hypothetical protein